MSDNTLILVSVVVTGHSVWFVDRETKYPALRCHADDVDQPFILTC